MPKTSFDCAQLADQMSESIICGNWGSVRDDLLALPKKRAVCVAAYVVSYLTATSDEYTVSRFLRLLEDATR